MRRITIPVVLLLAALLVSVPAWSQKDQITTAIGGGPNGIPAIDANLYNPYGMAVDTSGNYYFASFNQHRVFKVNTTGTISVVAGSGAPGFYGDGVVGGAGNASLNHPFAVAVDASNNIYIADQYNCVIRKVDTANTITTIAGTAGSCSYSGDGGKGTSAQLYYPQGVGLDASGNLFIGDGSNCVVRRVVLATDIISTYAGNHTCGYTGDGGAATSAELNQTSGVSVDSSGNLFIADTGNCVIREVIKATQKIATVAGNHTCGYAGDGGLATSAQMNQVFGLSVVGANIFIADFYNQRIREFSLGGNINTVAGTGAACAGTCGEGGPATSAQLYYPLGVVGTSGGTVYIANNDNYVIDSFTVGGNLNLAAGNHSATVETLITGAPASGVVLNYPWGIADDASGNVLIADSHNFMVRQDVAATNLVNFFAGNGLYGYTGDGGLATSAELTYTYGVAKDATGNVYIADTYNCLIRKVNTAGVISTFAGLVVNGSPRCGYSGDGGPATSASLAYPFGVSVDSKGNVYITDTNNHVVRKVTGGIITTIAGQPGIAGYGGDGGPATGAYLYSPEAVASDVSGNIFIADYNNCRIREINAVTNLITTFAGNGYCGYTGDGPATSNGVAYPQGVVLDANGNLFISDYNNRVRWVNQQGFMTTIAGTGNGGYSGDGGPATQAYLYEPIGVALDPAGNILVSDFNNFRVRKISTFPAVNTNAGNLSFALTSVGTTSAPQPVSVSVLGATTINSISSTGAFNEADNCPSAMPAGSACTMYVYFAPTASGTANGNVTINSNGFFNGVNTVYTSGLGTATALVGSPMAFGNQLAKTTSAAKVATLKNTGTTAITMGAISLTDATDYAISANTCPASGSPLAAGASCSISVTFTPQSTLVYKAAIVIKDSDPSSPQLVAITGTGTSSVALTPNPVTFPVTPIGVASAAQKITLTNNTGVSVTLGTPAITVTGPFINAATTTCTNGLVIAASGTCVINVTFKPTAAGAVTGTIAVADTDVTSPQTVALKGTGTAIKFTPATVNFGTVTRGVQVSSAVTITNVGTSNVYFTGVGISGPNSPDFADNYGYAAPCGNNINNPLKPGTTCNITVYFTPSIVGTENASYKVFDNVVGSPQSLTLTGKGQ